MTNKLNTKDMLGRAKLTEVAKAREIFLRHLPQSVTKTESVSLEQALSRITATEILSTEELPAFPRSSMDGYAVSARDTYGASESMPAYLEIRGEVFMGEIPEGVVEKGCCYKIPTGGIVPDGADSVVMFEHTVPVDETMIEVVKSVGEGGNISRPGDDIAFGQSAITKGIQLRPQDLGLLAGIGCTEVDVFHPVRVGIISTGDEIIHYSKTLTPGKIRNINSITLSGQIELLGATVTDYGIVSDNKSIFLDVINKAVKENDLVLFSGGSSVGMRDLGEQIIEQLGPPGVLVHGTALKPGKPVILGMSGTTGVVGLPGHPVSAMTCFDLFIAPAIRQLSGLRARSEKLRPRVMATLDRNMNSAPGRLDVVRVSISATDARVTASPVLGKSGSISVLSRADGFFIIDEATQGISEGDSVEVFRY